MQRKSPASKVERLTRRNKEAREQAAALASKLTRLAADNLEILRMANPAMPDLDSDRTIDNWEHPLAIAELAGDEWARQARIAALALSGAATETDDSLNIKLLTDIKAIIDADDSGRDRLGSTELCDRLTNLEVSPWATVSRGKPLTPARLARMLKIFEIRPSQDASGSGYAKADFTDAFSRYVLIPPDQSAKVPQTLGAVGESAVSEVPRDGTSENVETPTERATCGTMAVSNVDMPPDHTFSDQHPDAERFDSHAGIVDGGIPFVITRTMRQALLQTGFSDADIDGMTPAQAWEHSARPRPRKVRLMETVETLLASLNARGIRASSQTGMPP